MTYAAVLLYLFGIWALGCDASRESISLLYNNIPIDADELTVPAGSDVRITCDGSRGAASNPYMRWYGLDGHWVKERRDRRVRTESSLLSWYGYARFLTLVISNVKDTESGDYACSRLGPRGFVLKWIRINVEGPRTQTTTSRPRTTTAQPLTTTTRERTTTTQQRTTRQPRTTTTQPRTTTNRGRTTTSQPRPTTRGRITPQEHQRTTPQVHCPADQLMCVSDKKCKPGYMKCDNFPDCEDGSDERDCTPAESCHEDQVLCPDGSRCVKIPTGSSLEQACNQPDN